MCVCVCLCVSPCMVTCTLYNRWVRKCWYGDSNILSTSSEWLIRRTRLNTQSLTETQICQLVASDRSRFENVQFTIRLAISVADFANVVSFFRAFIRRKKNYSNNQGWLGYTWPNCYTNYNLCVFVRSLFVSLSLSACACVVCVDVCVAVYIYPSVQECAIQLW